MKLIPLSSITGHQRFGNKKHGFQYGFLSYWISFDKAGVADLKKWKKDWWLSVNKFNFFSFYEKDYFQIGNINNSLFERVQEFVGEEIVKINLLTGIRFLNYIFNPVSFYFVETAKCEKIVLCEIWNTFGEFKVVNLGKMKDGFLSFKFTKYFYVSPFINPDSELELDVNLIQDQIGNIKVTSKSENCTLVADWSFENLNKKIISYFPFSFKATLAIHLQALFIFIKGIGFYKKNENINLQQGQRLWKKY